jgi:hypothetical protein
MVKIQSTKRIIKKNNLDFFVSYILFFPPLMHGIGQSYSLGIVICALTLTPFYLRVLFGSSAKRRMLWLIVFFLLYSPISFYINAINGRDPDLTRWIQGSLAIMCLMILASIFSHIYLNDMKAKDWYTDNFKIFTALAIYSHMVLFLRFAHISPLNGQINSIIGIFSEPSHIAYVTAFLLFVKYSYYTRGVFLIYLFAALAFAVGIGSLVGTLVLMCVLFVVAERFQKYLVVIFSLLMVYFLWTTSDDFSFAAGSINLTGAVYLSGWQQAFIYLSETRLMGLGVNQFGVNGSQGFYADIIAKITDEEPNKYDGSFAFAKLVGEFGIFALFLTVYLLKIWTKCFIGNKHMKKSFLFGMVASYVILYFFRSPGYVCGASVIILAVVVNPELIIKSINKEMQMRLRT